MEKGIDESRFSITIGCRISRNDALFNALFGSHGTWIGLTPAHGPSCCPLRNACSETCTLVILFVSDRPTYTRTSVVLLATSGAAIGSSLPSGLYWVTAC